MAVVRISLAVVLCACSVAMVQGAPRMWLRSQVKAENYVVSEQAMSWGDAWDNCVQRGGHLLILDTKEEVDFIRSYMEFYGVSVSHVGLHDLFKSGKYTTIFGLPMDTTSFKWSSGEPNSDLDHCVLLNQYGYIVDIPCATQNRFICEIV